MRIDDQEASVDLDAVFAALADPTRRAILSRLTNGDASVGELAAPFNISQPAVSRHLKVLERAGLVERAIVRQQRPARLNAINMAAVYTWLGEFETFWSDSASQPGHEDVQTTQGAQPDVPKYALEQIFAAPAHQAWRAWSEPGLIARWYGPGVDTIIHRFDLRPGGTWRNEMKWGERSELSLSVFQEVVEGKRLVWHQSTCDPDWKAVPSATVPNWPQVMRVAVAIVPEGRQTKVRLSIAPVDATVAERACFEGAMTGLDRGWRAGFDLMGKLLDELHE